MGRRFYILIGMVLAAAVVVPLALAQQKDPLPGNDPEAVLGSDKPVTLPPPETPRKSAKAAAKSKNRAAQPKTAAAKDNGLGLNPTPGVPLASELPGASEAGTVPNGDSSKTSAGQEQESNRGSEPSAVAALPGEPPASSTPKSDSNESGAEVPPQPPVNPIAKPGALPGAGDPPPAVTDPSRSAEREGSRSGLEEIQPGRLPAADEKTFDPQVDRTQAPATLPAPAAGGAAAAEPGSSLPLARELPAGGAGAIGSSNALALPASTIPLGKQSYGLSVEVQSPQFANLNQDTNLKIIVRNTGQSDALNVIVTDQLPNGVHFVSSSQPPAQPSDRILVWTLDRIAAGSDHTITVRVRPTEVGPFDHAASVTMLAGSKSRTTVRQPKLKVELVAKPQRVEKGQQVEFNIRVSNTGDGPARDVIIQATLSAGLRHESGTPDAANLLELSIARLDPGTHTDLEPLVVDAVGGGDQSCSVIVKSKDVVTADNDPDSRTTLKVPVTEPKLTVKLTGPSQQYTDTTAPYTLTVTNSGTAPTRKVTARAMLQLSGQLIRASDGWKYDKEARTVYWILPQLAPGETKSFIFEIRMSGIGFYRIDAAAKGAGGLHSEEFLRTDVKGMADIRFDVSESRRVVDINDETTFQVKITNAGTKEATDIYVSGEYSENIEAIGKEQDANEQDSAEDMKLNLATRQILSRKPFTLGAGKTKVIKVRVRAKAHGFATFKFNLVHGDLPKDVKLMEMATVQVTDTVRK